MSEFWLWFIRPIAEFFGVVALLGVFFLGIFGWLTFQDWRRKKEKDD